MEPLIPPEDPSFERRSSEDPTFERRPSMSSEDSSSSAFRPSQSTSQLPNPSSSGDTSGAPHRATQSTSRLPFLPLNNGTQHIKPDLWIRFYILIIAHICHGHHRWCLCKKNSVRCKRFRIEHEELPILHFLRGICCKFWLLKFGIRKFLPV